MIERIALDILVVSVLTGGIRAAAPILFASLGEVVTERGGIMNLGLEGIMLTTAFGGFAGAFFSNNLWIGVLTGISVGAGFGFLIGVVAVKFRVNQVVTGIAVWILGTGISNFAYRLLWGKYTKPPTVEGFKTVSLPFLSQIPYVGKILFTHNIFVYIAILLVPVISFFLFRTTIGLKIRSVGENPKSAETLGVNAYHIRYLSVILGSALVGLGGAYLPLAYVGTFAENIVGGRGWIAFSIVIFAKWKPIGALYGALLFGTVDALQLSLQALGFPIPYEFLLMLPYILTILVLIGMTGRAGMPESLGKPYTRS